MHIGIPSELFNRNSRKTWSSLFFFFNDTATTEIYTLSLHDALPISERPQTEGLSMWACTPRRARALVGSLRRQAERFVGDRAAGTVMTFALVLPVVMAAARPGQTSSRSEEHTSELQSLRHLVCRLLL